MSGTPGYIPAAVYLIVILIITCVTSAPAENLKCDYCGRTINGEYMISNHKNYHVDCYENNVALKCALCGGIINGEYYEDFWGNKVHAEHKNHTPQCEYCRRFISDEISRGSVKYDDGRLVCGICAGGAIKDAVKAEAIKSSLQKSLAEYGIATAEMDIPLYLVNKKSMGDLAEGYHADPLGFAHYERTSYVGGMITDQSFKIYMLKGLPRSEFISALAHELMHIWLFIHAPVDMDPALREGSCNYAAFLTLLKDSGRETQFVVDNMMSDPNPVYGDGFRRIKTFVEKNGIPHWLNYLKNNKQPPW